MLKVRVSYDLKNKLDLKQPIINNHKENNKVNVQTLMTHRGGVDLEPPSTGRVSANSSLGPRVLCLSS